MDDELVAWSEYGQGAPTLVFVHGWQCDRSYWRAQVEHFAPRHRLLLPDLVGHGTSGKARDDWSIEAFGRDIASLVAAEVDGPVVLVGHSMGGPIILEAARHLDNVVGLVAVDTLRDLDLQAPSPEARPAQLRAIRKNYAVIAGAFVENFFIDGTDPELQLAITEGILAGDPDRGVAMIGAVWEVDLPALLEASEVPLELINSDYVPTDVEGLRNHHRDLTFTAMRGVGHFPMLEAPDAFNRHLEAALAQLGSRE